MCATAKLPTPPTHCRINSVGIEVKTSMTHIRYDIIPQGGGWSIAMGGAVGPPYMALNEAVRDTEHVASMLTETGDLVDIVVWQGGQPVLLERLEPRRRPKPD
jgi:hypothetical protein